MKKQEKVSTAVIRRLPRYYRRLSELQRKGAVRISSSALGKDMGLTASQIRQDLSCFGEFGQQGYGYQVDSLREEIGEILGINRGHSVIVLGAGNLGRALMENFEFLHNGFHLLAAFDVDENKVGREISGVPVYHLDTLESFLTEHPVSVGLLTVPRCVAKSVAQRLVDAGIQGLWNFTNCELVFPERDVVVESVHFSDSLLTLSYLISQQQIQEEPT